MDSATIVVLSALVIGPDLRRGRGCCPGFCMMSSLRGWWALRATNRLVRTYALGDRDCGRRDTMAGGGWASLTPASRSICSRHSRRR